MLFDIIVALILFQIFSALSGLISRRHDVLYYVSKSDPHWAQGRKVPIIRLSGEGPMSTGFTLGPARAIIRHAQARLPAENYLRGNVRLRRSRPPDLLRRLQVQPRDT